MYLSGPRLARRKAHLGIMALKNMNREDFFIKSMREGSRRIGDDGAIVDSWVYSKDAFFENVHFKRGWMSAYQVAKKAMLVNLSDAIAMNARPQYALLAVAMPRSMSRSDMHELSRGFQESAAAYGVEIIGGDTIANCKLDISVTIISSTEKPLLRRGVRRGDLIAHTGSLGKAQRHLRYLLAGGRLHGKSRFHDLSLRGAFVTAAASKLRAGMDISDGLFSDLEKLSRLNRCGFRFFKRSGRQVGCSGEEYEMLVAVAPGKRLAVMRLAAKSRTPLHFIGTATRGSFTNRCRRHHF